MRLNCWKAWLVLGILTTVATSTLLAQATKQSISELGRLTNWYPIVQMGQTVISQTIPPKNTFRSFADLAQKAKNGEKIESITITGELWKLGEQEKLAQLQDVRNLSVFGLTAQQVDSLGAYIKGWTRLEGLKLIGSYIQVNPVNKTEQTSIPVAVQQWPSLKEVSLEGLIDWDMSLKRLAGIKSLLRLEIRNWGIDKKTVFNLSAFPQVKELKLSGMGWVLPANARPSSSQLTKLTLENVTADTLTVQQMVDGLPNLEHLIIQNVSSLQRLRFNQLTKLNTLDLEYNQNLTLTAASLTGLSTLNELIIRGCKKVDLSAICSLTGLRVFVYGGIGLPVEMPFCLEQLVHLKELGIENADLARSASKIGSLKQLQKLSITRCNLDTIPLALGQLTSLKNLSLVGNKLRQFPGIQPLKSLEELTLFNNQLTALPEYIGQLSMLKTLLVFGNKLTSIPASIGQLRNLSNFDLHDNQLEQLPNELGELKKLKTLSLNNNKLTTLPESIGNLDSLAYLLIGTNRLRALPGTLTKLTNLVELSIQTNELTALPAALGNLKKLKRLTIGPNPISELPVSIAWLYNLESLAVMGTKLRLLPEELGKLTKLNYVSLQNNDLVALPNSIGQWENVVHLTLDNNQLSGLPNTIGRMKNLTQLTISNKQVDGAVGSGEIFLLPDSIVQCSKLMELSIKNVPQLDVDDVFRKISSLKKLTNVNLSGCSIRQLPVIDWSKMELQSLSLNQNLLTELPVQLLDAPKLTRIMLSGNRLPEPLNRDIFGKEELKIAFVEAGKLSAEVLPKPSRNVSQTFSRMAMQQTSQRNFDGALINLDKAIEYAPDTVLSTVYAQRATLFFVQKAYEKSLADNEKAIENIPGLRKDTRADTLMVRRILASCWQQKAVCLWALGRQDAGLKAIQESIHWLPTQEYTPMSAQAYLLNGQYLLVKDEPAKADSSFRRSINIYEKMLRAEPGTQLTIVELCLLTGQYTKAKTLLNSFTNGQFRGGYATLKEYLNTCLEALTDQQTNEQALAHIQDYLKKNNVKIYSWSFDMFMNWLNKTKLPPDKVATLRQLTELVKENAIKQE